MGYILKGFTGPVHLAGTAALGLSSQFQPKNETLSLAFFPQPLEFNLSFDSVR